MDEQVHNSMLKLRYVRFLLFINLNETVRLLSHTRQTTQCIFSDARTIHMSHQNLSSLFFKCVNRVSSDKTVRVRQAIPNRFNLVSRVVVDQYITSIDSIIEILYRIDIINFDIKIFDILFVIQISH